MTIQNLYNITFDVLRISKTSDGLGSWTEIEAIQYSNLRGRINWTKGSEKVQFNKDTWFRDAKLYCNVVDIQVKDRILYDSKYYDVVDVSNPDEASKYLIVELKRMHKND